MGLQGLGLVVGVGVFSKGMLAGNLLSNSEAISIRRFINQDKELLGPCAIRDIRPKRILNWNPTKSRVLKPYFAVAHRFGNTEMDVMDECVLARFEFKMSLELISYIAQSSGFLFDMANFHKRF